MIVWAEGLIEASEEGPMAGEEEVQVTCPHCYSAITFLLEVYHGDQSYIEDCEVCCQPIEISYTVVDDHIESIDVKSAEE